MAIPGHSSPFGPFNQSCWSSASMSDNCFGLHSANLLFSISLTGGGRDTRLHRDGPCAVEIGTNIELNSPMAPTKAIFREKTILMDPSYCCEPGAFEADALAVLPMASPLTTSSTR